MYDINFKNLKSGFNFFLIFFLLGLGFIIYFTYAGIKDYLYPTDYKHAVVSNSVSVSSYVNEEEKYVYTKTYHFTFDGKLYSCDINGISNEKPKEENRTIYFDDYPESCVDHLSRGQLGVYPLFILGGLIFMLIGLVNIRKITKSIKNIKYLNMHGKLVKNLPYYTEASNIAINDRVLERLVVDYTFPNGRVISLYSDLRYDGKTYDNDGMVDLLIDENDPTKYFIDLEINRKSGNLSTDYYYQNSDSNENNSNKTF